jgi:DNA-binding MarR family transcriptional regulator
MEALLVQFVDTFDATLKKMHKALSAEAGFGRLTISQLQYIDAIAALGEPNITALAGRLAVTKASTTVGINKLVKMGYVQKKRSPHDGRVYLVTLTPAGERLTAAKHQALKNYGDFIRAALTVEELRQFEHILTRLVKQFNADAAGPHPGDS